MCLSHSRGLHQTLLIDHGPGCCCLCSGVGLAEEAGGLGELNKVERVGGGACRKGRKRKEKRGGGEKVNRDGTGRRGCIRDDVPMQ